MMCTPGDAEMVVPLQVADLMAYEYYRRLRQHASSESISEPRAPLRLIRENNNYAEGFFGEFWFLVNKAAIESMICGPNQLGRVNTTYI